MTLQNLRLIAVIDENLATNKYGYQIGAVVEGKWTPLLIATALWSIFDEAAYVASRQLEIAKKAISKRKDKNIRFSQKQFNGPEAS